MRRLLIAAIGLGLLAAAARADDQPVANQLPDNTRMQQVYLFLLKSNDVSLHMRPQAFCSQLGYGEAVQDFWDQGADGVGKDGKAIPGELAWVICQFPRK